MRRLQHSLLFLGLITSTTAVPTFAQSIFVSNDEWFTSQAGLPLANDTQLTLNAAAWLTDQAPGKNILILSSNFGLNNAALQTLLISNGYTVTRTTIAPSTFLTAGGAPMWDAVFVSGDCHLDPLVFVSALCNNGFANLNTALTNYVIAGGNVLLEVGLVCNAGSATWDTFLNTFSLSITHGCNGILASQVNVSSFQTQAPYGPDLFNGVNSVYIDNGEDVFQSGNDCGVQIFTDANGNGLYGAWRPCCVSGNQLLINGSFETGDFTGWTTSGNFEYSEVVTGPFYFYSVAENGSYYAVLGPVGSDGVLSQNVSTVAANVYAVCFWLNAVGDNPSDFKAYWDGNLKFGKNNPNTGNVWRPVSFLATGTGFDSLSFAFRDDPGYIAFDNVVVSPF